MKSLALLAIALTISCASTAEASFSAIQTQAVAASRARAEAFNVRDLAAFARATAPDCVITGEDGAIHSVKATLAEFRSLPSADEQFVNLRDYQARTFGNVVVLNFVYDDLERFGASQIDSKVRSTEVWKRMCGRWMMLAKSLTSIPVNHRPGIAVDLAKLAEYVGRFEWRPGSIDELSIEGEHLVSRFNGAGAERTYFAAPDVNITEGDLGEVLFQRSAAGTITGYLYRRADGQTIAATKLP